jgi:hypothetical protein
MIKPHAEINSACPINRGHRLPVWLGICKKSWLTGLAAMLTLMPGFGLAYGQEFMVTNPRMVEAAYLRNFAHYVTWPANAFSDTLSPWCIGVLGDDPFGDILERTFANRREHGRAFKVVRAKTPRELPPCHIVFIAIKEAGKRKAVLEEFKDKPVLTVGDAEDFFVEGGIIRFEIGDRVKMSINLDRARSANLTIPTEMLEVSEYVMDNNVLHRLR